MNAYWCAANYLSVGQIYLFDNPLLKRPIKREDVKPRCSAIGVRRPASTSSMSISIGLLMRTISVSSTLPALARRPRPCGQHLSRRHLQRSHPNIEAERRRHENASSRNSPSPAAFRSHVAPETPGSIHEGGELGYSLAHAYGAAFDNPDLLLGLCRRRRRGGNRRPGNQSGTSRTFSIRQPDGAVPPILHLNGYKIAGPTVFGSHQP